MAKLKKTKTEFEVKCMSPTEVRKEYLDLADEYLKISRGNIIFCPQCGKFYAKTNFYKSNETKTGVNHLGCKDCIEKMATVLNRTLNSREDDKESAIKVLRKLDLPFIEHVYDNSLEIYFNNRDSNSSGWKVYISTILSLPQYKGKTYSDSKFLNSENDLLQEKTENIRPEIKEIFGRGFTNEDYLYLQEQYDSWNLRTQVDSISQETYIIRICFKLLDIYKAERAGKDTDKLDRSLNELLAAANLQPRQNVGNASTDALTFGQLIEKWELEKPIPEPEPLFKDIDKIGKYIRVWFKGNLARVLNLDNGYSKEYDDFIKDYSVKKLEDVEEDGKSENIYNAIFGKDSE